MKKELKFFIYSIIIFIFCIFTLRYYFSDENKKKNYRSTLTIEKKIQNFSKDIPILKSNTENIIEYIDIKEEKQKKFNFWSLLTNEN
mgnify:CR=1 FL=1|tara:strand:+ start:228 stop:488 length:261 start_codon:yes stop_codon:yes gene_type:complete